MIVRRVRWWGYRVPFCPPFVTARGALTEREGLLVEVETDDGRRGMGEIAPLPGFGGTVADALRVLPGVANRLLGRTIDDAMPAKAHFSGAGRSAGSRRQGKDSSGPQPEDALSILAAALPTPFQPGEAAVRCGLETALLDLLAHRQECAVVELLVAGAHLVGACPGLVAHPQRERGSRAPGTRKGLHLHGTCASQVPVNATVGAAGAGQAALLAVAAVAAGYRTVKLKAGPASDPTAEAARLAAVRAAVGSDVYLRLDANGSWTPDQAIAIIRACEPANLEFVEQPVPADDVDGLAHVCRSVGTVIAADEAATDRYAVQRLLEAGAAGAIVLKPMAAGGILECVQMSRLACQAAVLVVVTSSLETGVGVAAAAHLAAALPGPLPACGLATTALLESDLLQTPLVIADGALTLPTGPGLGVAPDWKLLARYASRLEGIVEVEG